MFLRFLFFLNNFHFSPFFGAPSYLDGIFCLRFFFLIFLTFFIRTLSFEVYTNTHKNITCDKILCAVFYTTLYMYCICAFLIYECTRHHQRDPHNIEHLLILFSRFFPGIASSLESSQWSHSQKILIARIYNKHIYIYKMDMDALHFSSGTMNRGLLYSFRCTCIFIIIYIYV